MKLSEIEDTLLNVLKPARYIGGEQGAVIKDKTKIDVRFAFCFPDIYDIGMSHLGMKILYSLINERGNYWCERVFAPWKDFEKIMRERDIPLYALESFDPISEFDFVGFTIQYEMCYTTIINMLDLAGIPVFSKDRKECDPIVVGGGPCTCNPEPLSDFFDIFILGEGEEVNLELMDLYCEMKKGGSYTRQDFLKNASKITGIYVPIFFDVEYNIDGTVKSIKNNVGESNIVLKRVVRNMDTAYYPENFVVPYTEIVHDRAVSEILRGCIRGCRFCQAGFIYRPYREKSADTVINQSIELCRNTGYEQISMSSLSSADHSEIEKIVSGVLEYTEKKHVTISLPSTRIDAFSEELMNKIKSVSKTGLTFAPEAGTQRLRDVINKNITEEEIIKTCNTAFSGGYFVVKLYFMMGLPTETDEDILGIANLAEKIVETYYKNENRSRKKLQISISIATFVPKPVTPFEFEPQIDSEKVKHRQELLRNSIKSKSIIKISYNDSPLSLIEAVLARGDRRLNNVLYDVWKQGGNLEAWEENFNIGKWKNSFIKYGLEMSFYANRERSYNEIMPWDHLDYGVSKEFLIRENKKARNAETSPNCREKCMACGMGKICGIWKNEDKNKI